MWIWWRIEKRITEENRAAVYGILGVGLFIGLVVGLGSVGLVDLVLDSRKAKRLNREEKKLKLAMTIAGGKMIEAVDL